MRARLLSRSGFESTTLKMHRHEAHIDKSIHSVQNMKLFVHKSLIAENGQECILSTCGQKAIRQLLSFLLPKNEEECSGRVALMGFEKQT